MNIFRRIIAALGPAPAPAPAPESLPTTVPPPVGALFMPHVAGTVLFGPSDVPATGLPPRFGLPAVAGVRHELTVSDFLRYRETETAYGVPRKKPIFFCPSCGVRQPHVPVHGDGDVCHNSCGLHWIAYGNGLTVWREK